MLKSFPKRIMTIHVRLRFLAIAHSAADKFRKETQDRESHYPRRGAIIDLSTTDRECRAAMTGIRARIGVPVEHSVFRRKTV